MRRWDRLGGAMLGVLLLLGATIQPLAGPAADVLREAAGLTTGVSEYLSSAPFPAWMITSGTILLPHGRVGVPRREHAPSVEAGG